ncbi:hypothetical protein ACHAO8_006787 [Botrytis cinerea]
MASMGGGSFLDPEPYVRKVKNGGMLNQTLKNICVAEDMKVNGVKAELQTRIVDRIRYYANAPDEIKFNRLGRIIDHPEIVAAGVQSRPFQGSASPAANSMSNGAANYSAPRAAMQPYKPMGYGMKLDFKPSPFYDFVDQIGEVKLCDAMNQHRHTVNIPVKAQNYSVLSKVQNDPTLRVMIFCASEGNGPQDIAFPHQSEVKVNGGDVKANLRGLKNKPGSTRPVDITKELRLKVPGYQNTVEMTYALTTKAGLINGAFVSSEKFYFVLNVVRLIPVPDLVKKLQAGTKITKQSVINEMISKSRDVDIVATASVLSLKCPLSTLRIDLPIRSVACRHNQCFDATSYLQLQEQGPTWLCPICNNPAPFGTLVVDEYVKDILQNTSKSVDQVTVEPQGQWKLYNRPDTISSRPGVASSDFSDDDDDLIEVSPGGRKASTPITKNGISNGNLNQAPSTRDSLSAAPSNRSNPLNSSTGGKRPISEVIDLCSSDEEESPPPKRQMTSSFSGPSYLSGVAPLPRPGYPDS